MIQVKLVPIIKIIMGTHNLTWFIKDFCIFFNSSSSALIIADTIAPFIPSAKNGRGQNNSVVSLPKRINRYIVPGLLKAGRHKERDTCHP